MSAPQPDKLSLIIPISKYVYGKKAPDVVSEATLLLTFGQTLSSNYPTEIVSKKFFENKWTIGLMLGLADSHVYLTGYKHKTLGPALRIEFNPRKLGPAGSHHLIALLGINELLDPTRLLQVARVSRLDVAVDVVGLRVDEIVARNVDEGVRSMYVGKDGALETIYLHRKKPPPKAKLDVDGCAMNIMHPTKPAGVVLVAIYDKVKERAARGKAPPFGPVPVSRIEVSKRRFVNQPLATIGQLGDMFKGTYAGFSRSQISSPLGPWDQYRRLRYTMPHDDAVALMSAQALAADAFTASYSVPVADLCGPTASWLDWSTGLKATGLATLVAKAGPGA